jgi:hypothetical protein
VVVVDYFSRRALAARSFKNTPSAADACSVLDGAISSAGTAPKYTVTDQGPQFQSEYRKWCECHGVKARFGAVGEHGSIALVERFILSFKREAFGAGLVPLGSAEIEELLEAYLAWYAIERPHQGLGGRTPLEVFDGKQPAHGRPRLEPRVRYPPNAPCAAPLVAVRGRPGAKVELIVEHPAGLPHLPVVRIRRAA